MEQRRMRQSRSGVSRSRSNRPLPGKKVSFIQLMGWESQFIMSGREKSEHLGAAFCKDFEIDDARLADTHNPTAARQIIFGKYITTDTRYHQNVTAAHEDLAELYPVDSSAA